MTAATLVAAGLLLVFSGTANGPAGDPRATGAAPPAHTQSAAVPGVSWALGARPAPVTSAFAVTPAPAGEAGRPVPSAPPTTFASAAAATYRATVLADTPRGYWRLGETSGTAAADEMATSSGIYTGGVTLAQAGAISGDANTAARLDGVNDTVRIPNAAALNSTTALTLEAFVRPGTLPASTATVMRKDLQYLLRITSAGGVIFRLWKGGENELTTPAGTLPANSWSHVAATYDGTTMRIYVGGTLRGSRTLASPVADANLGPLPGCQRQLRLARRPPGRGRRLHARPVGRRRPASSRRRGARSRPHARRHAYRAGDGQQRQRRYAGVLRSSREHDR